MCEKATEIHKGGNVVYTYGDYFVYQGTIYICNDMIMASKPGYLWLPRQDQLQEMLKGLQVDSHVPRKQVLALWKWIASTSPKPDDSMEQLWLAFVEKEKHNKVWDSEKEDWIHSNDRPTMPRM